jgi:hypothetical protein
MTWVGEREGRFPAKLLRGRHKVSEDKSPKISRTRALRRKFLPCRRSADAHAFFEKESHNNFSLASLTISINRLFNQSKRIGRAILWHTLEAMCVFFALLKEKEDD